MNTPEQQCPLTSPHPSHPNDGGRSSCPGITRLIDVDEAIDMVQHSGLPAVYWESNSHLLRTGLLVAFVDGAGELRLRASPAGQQALDRSLDRRWTLGHSSARVWSSVAVSLTAVVVLAGANLLTGDLPVPMVWGVLIGVLLVQWHALIHAELQLSRTAEQSVGSADRLGRAVLVALTWANLGWLARGKMVGVTVKHPGPGGVANVLITGPAPPPPDGRHPTDPPAPD